MEIDRAAGVLVALRRCTVDKAFDEIINAAKRHRVQPLEVARALVALAEGAGHDDDPAAAAARFEWGSLLEPRAMSQ
jgi:hypothetical protein